MIASKVTITKDLRDRLATPTKERWYNNIVLLVPPGTEKVFVPEMQRNNIKVLISEPSRYDENETALQMLLNEHSLLISIGLCSSNIFDKDICIGVNRDWSRPTDFVIDLVSEGLEKLGYRVGDNKPFTFAYSIEKDCGYNAISLVVNKSLYMNEKTKEFTVGAAKLRKDMETLYGILNNYWEEI